MKFFSDFKPGGALCIILSTMYRFKSEQRWKKFDFTINKVSCCCDWMLCSAHSSLHFYFRPAPRKIRTFKCSSKLNPVSSTPKSSDFPSSSSDPKSNDRSPQRFAKSSPHIKPK